MTPRRRIPFHLTYPLQRTVRAAPALCPGRVLLLWVPLGQSPSLRLLRRRHEAGFVRRLLRYYGTVRLPLPVHHRRMLKVSDYDRLTGQRLCPPSEGKMEDGQDERERVETAGRSGAGAGGVAEQRGGGGGAGDIGAADAPSAGTGWRIGAQRGAARQHGARAGESGGEQVRARVVELRLDKYT